MITSEDVREELAQIAPTRARATGSPSCPRSSTPPEASTCAARRVGAPSRPRERRRRAPRLRAPARRGDPLRDSHVPAARVRPRHAVPAPRRRRRPRARRPRRGRAWSIAATRRSSARLAGSSLAAAAGPRTSAARSSAAARSRSALGAPRAPDGDARGRALLCRQVAAEAGVRSAVGARPRTPPRTRRAGTRSSRSSPWRARPRPCSPSRNGPSWPRRAPRANRLANADHANLVRTSRAARLQLEAVDASRRRGGSSGSRTAPGGRRAPAPPSRRSRSASSRHAPTRRRARRRCTAGCAASRSSLRLAPGIVPGCTMGDTPRLRWARATAAADPDPICRGVRCAATGEGVVLGARPLLAADPMRTCAKIPEAAPPGRAVARPRERPG